jgi:hypothetical protein
MLIGIFAGIIGGVLGPLLYVLLRPRQLCPDCGAPLTRMRNCWGVPGVVRRCGKCGCGVNVKGVKVASDVPHKPRPVLAWIMAAGAIALVFGLLCAGLVAYWMIPAANTNIFATFAPEGGYFFVEMPGNPRQSREHLTGSDGPEFVTYESRTTSQRGIWRVGYADSPPTLQTLEEVVNYLEGLPPRIAAVRGKRLVNETRLPSDFESAAICDFELSTDDGQSFHRGRIRWVSGQSIQTLQRMFNQEVSGQKHRIVFQEVIGYPPLQASTRRVESFFHIFHIAVKSPGADG